MTDGDTTWPCHGRSSGARRYCLIGSFDGTSWFYIGEDITKFSTVPRENARPATLWLAVNRENWTQPAQGDGQWDVTVECFEPSPGYMGGPDPVVCGEVRREMSRLRTDTATDICEDLGRSKRALLERQEQTMVSFEIAGGLAIAVTLLAVAPLVPVAVGEHTAQRTALEVLREILRRAIEEIHPVVAATSAAVTAIAAASSARSATTAARAASSPATANVFIAVATAALIIAMIAAAVVAIALLLSQLTLAAEHDNNHSRWNSVRQAVRSLADLSRTVCEPPHDETLPACPEAGG
jgi:hypothetical protein